MWNFSDLVSKGHDFMQHFIPSFFSASIQDADVIVGSLSVTTERDAVVDFTLPYYDFAGIQILVKKKAQETKLFYFLDVFHLDVWLCLVAVLITTSILLYMFDRFSPFTNVDQNGEQKVFNMKESMWFVIGSLTQSGE